MWLNKNNGTKISRATALTINDVQHPKSIFTKWTEEELNAINIFTIEKIVTIPNRRFYTHEVAEDLEATPPTITTTAIPLDLDVVKTNMKADVSKQFKVLKERPRVELSLGFDVDGGSRRIKMR